VQVSADEDRCVGAGSCVMSAPEVFDQDDYGTVVVRDEDPDESQWPAVAEAIAICPAAALRIVRESTP
jgi:ferredoxin